MYRLKAPYLAFLSALTPHSNFSSLGPTLSARSAQPRGGHMAPFHRPEHRPTLPLKLYLALVVQGGANLVPWQVFIAPAAPPSPPP